ncbi:MAG: YraN family protein [bacterium]|nr:YraN family protein [bacterium]
MIDQRKDVGRRGESFAAAFFLAKGFRVVDRNWNCRLGEIDLVVEKDGMTHFVEVKTRLTMDYGYPEEAITKTKLRHLAKAIELYLRIRPSVNYQADALAIYRKPEGEPEVEWIQNII